ncbi:unnamed protein product [Victoria cruziana]
MLEQSIPAIWASMHSWFTPTVLFVLLNLVIGTIIATSGGAGQKSGDKPLARSPSVMERIRSIKLHKQEVEDVPAVTVTKPAEPEIVSAVDEIFHDGGEPGDDVAAPRSGGGAAGEDAGAAEETPVRRRRLKKWASEKLPAADGVKEEIPNRRGESVRGHRRVEEFDDDSGGEEVDAKADDFINRFKQQLQLQRMESIMRHKEMLSRGR